MCNQNTVSFEEYFDKIESYFALKRDKAVLLSPEEFEVVEFFYNQGAPLQIVFRGIDRFFEKKKKRKRKVARFYFLTHVKDDIVQVWQDYKKKGAGSYLATGEGEKQFIEHNIAKILKSLETVHSSLKPLSSEIAEKLEKIKEMSETLTLEDAEREAEAILQFATERIFDILNNELTEVKAEVEREVEAARESLGKDIPEDVLDRFKKQIIFEKLNFPNITLLG